MRPHHLLNTLSVLSLTLLWPAPATGQWAVGFEVGADRYWGSSIETTEPHRSFRPYRPTSLGLGLEKRGNRLGAALHLHYSGASFALEGSDALAALKGIFTVFHASAELIYRVATLGGANQLRLHGGPMFEVWGVEEEDTQYLVGGQCGMSLRVPLGGRFAGIVAANLALTGSPLPENEPIEGFERRALWRRSVGAALQYQL
jgi:hypothetical protein